MTATALAVSDLDERIVEAFRDGAKSTDVVKLIKETEAAAAASGDAAEQSRKRALDPALAPADVVVARREMEDAAFRRDRLGTAVQRLGDRLNELRAKEEDGRRRLTYDKVKAERDLLADELARLYPPMVSQLRELLGRIADNDRRIELVNRVLPRRSGPLVVAELVARGLTGFTENWVQVPSIVESVRLPTFERTPQEPYAWPRQR
jgi:hypothetical protein